MLIFHGTGVDQWLGDHHDSCLKQKQTLSLGNLELEYFWKPEKVVLSQLICLFGFCKIIYLEYI